RSANRPAERQHQLVLTNGGDVQVTVLNAATRQPVAAAQVIIDHGPIARTDAEGAAHLSAVPMGEGVLKVVAPPYADAQISFNSQGRAEVRLEALLEPGFAVRGRVLDPSGQPVRGAVVSSPASGKRFQTGMRR